MVSSVFSRLRIYLSAITLIVLLSSLAPAPAQAKNRYEYTDRSEGDPGDGVLDPAVDDSGNEDSDGKRATPVNTTNSITVDWLRSPGDLFLTPIYLPGNPTGYRLIVILPQTWSRIAPSVRMLAGRWHDEP